MNRFLFFDIKWYKNYDAHQDIKASMENLLLQSTREEGEVGNCEEPPITMRGSAYMASAKTVEWAH